MPSLVEPIEYEVPCPEADCEWVGHGLHYSNDGLDEIKERILGIHQQMSHPEEEPIAQDPGELHPQSIKLRSSHVERSIAQFNQFFSWRRSERNR